MISGDIHDRTTSGFPLSISTGLAMESIFTPRQAVYDPARSPPQKINIANYTQFWVNVNTLYRNIVSAAGTLAVLSAGNDVVQSILEMEMDIIASLLKHEGMGVCTPVFYCVDYSKIFEGQHQSIKRRAEGSKSQLDLAAIYKEVQKSLLKKDAGVILFEPKLRPNEHTKALILTHYPYDLLSHKRFSKLDLLESNTGKLKDRRKWNTKYYPVGEMDMSHLPFEKILLMVLGDKSLIHPNIYKLRQQIVQASLKRHWTPLTTRDKIIMDLELEIKEPYVLAVLRAIR